MLRNSVRGRSTLLASARVATWALLACTACGGDEPPPRRGISPVPPVPPSQAPAAGHADERPGTRAGDRLPRTNERWPGAGASPEPEARGETPSEPPAATSNAAPERHLDQELTALLRPADCLDVALAAARPGGHLTIHVDAVVMPSGRISRATATAAGQPDASLRCLEDQLQQASLTPPIPDAPRHVTGTTRMKANVVPPAPVGQP